MDIKKPFYRCHSEPQAKNLSVELNPRRDPSLALRMTAIGFIIFLLPISLIPACSKSSSSIAASQKILYHCAMHPKIVSDKPGECPICHMRLTPVDTGAPQSSGEASSKEVLYYRNPMNPSVTSPVPMKDAMGMDYIPVYAGQNQVGTTIPGQATIHLTPGIEQQIGVTLALAEKRDLILPIRAAARVAYDPQLYNASLEHQEAASFLRKAREQSSPDLLEQAESTVHSSELRLRQMGLSDSEIAEIEKPDYNPSNLLVGSKNGKVWVYASVYDYEASLIRSGQDVEFDSPGVPGEVFHGTVRGIDPILNNDTRTLRVRIEVPNSQGVLRPETYLNATIHASLGRRLAIPESAVVDTGTRQLVYVQTQPGTYEPREVRIGHPAGVYDEVLEGLREGEKVVASANFLIDSESRIQAAAQEATKNMGAQ